jgi:hypothetical protein
MKSLREANTQTFNPEIYEMLCLLEYNSLMSVESQRRSE